MISILGASLSKYAIAWCTMFSTAAPASPPRIFSAIFIVPVFLIVTVASYNLLILKISEELDYLWIAIYMPGEIQLTPPVKIEEIVAH
jgi:hypothetical protein